MPSTIRHHIGAHRPIFKDGLWHILPVANTQRLPLASVDYADDHHPATRASAEHNARRIVSCVNALDGLPQDALDGGWTSAGISAYAKKLEGVNADLLAALKRCRFDSLNMSLEDLACCRAAIARATGAL